ncbi:Pyridoxamine kinase [Wickerhamomyces ciferrii]|uniref:pyridoxal kinase n=1 Tax=Wickerhamomyces ciferrii (strain ATCC 14091 / BCRC 22168 / CBS 111 / JCM 3599 / NBRC 0793 / NRRL Y-1031 F-60-10) TaxID=1206466 RepID=K0KIJ4_WICCF|nr:Pyridoxamine kinase [Wickerhamomyces ciferrii]CCH42002.1 Pyridoxamine kinase [Wickerhamomyces ciferrii]
MTKESNRIHRLLSVQSHVVHGYVGNSAATFPLQYRGWDVDALNTVQFSNHPGYGTFKGTRSSADDLKEIYQGLNEIGTSYDAVLTGYIPGDEGLKAVGEICKDLVRNDHHVKWILDPVLGDNGKIYVSEGNIEMYKQLLQSGYVSLVTPNQLELEVLTGVQVKDLKSLEEAITKFHELYDTIENLVVTSVQFDDDKTHLYSAGSTKINEATITHKTFHFKVPTINASFSGSGDLFSGLLTSAFFKYYDRFEGSLTNSTPIENLPLVQALNEVLTIVEKVLLLTFEYQVELYKQRGEPLPDFVKINDLKLVQSRDFFLQDLGKFEPKSFN